MEESLKTRRIKKNLKISFNLLASAFGSAVAYKVYKSNSKSNKINEKLIAYVRNHFEEKNKNFVKFVQNYLKEKDKYNAWDNKDNSLGVISFDLMRKDQLEGKLASECGRYFIYNMKEIFTMKSTAALTIQKYFRGYLGVKKSYMMYVDYFKKKILSSVRLIQSSYRGKQGRKDFMKNFIMHQIIESRKISIFKITSILTLYNLKLKFKKNHILKDIIVLRKKASTLIQNCFRRHIVRKKVQEIIQLEKTHYYLNYPFIARKVQLKVFISLYENDSEAKIVEKIFDFSYCNVRQTFVLYIEPTEFKPSKYRTQLIVDSLVTCDGRFPHIECSDGLFYNVMDFNLKRNSYGDQGTNTRPFSNSEESSLSSLSCTKCLKSESNCDNFIYLKENLEAKDAISNMDVLSEFSINDISLNF